MLIAFRPTMMTLPAKYGSVFNKLPILTPKLLIPSSISRTNFRFRSNFGCYCTKEEITDKPAQGFSALSSDIPWERGDIWSIMAMYMFNLHIPLGIGGLSIVAYLLHQPVLNPQTEVLSLLVFQILELTGAVILLRMTAKAEHELLTFFKSVNLAKERNWLLASALGFGFLISLVFLTSATADMLIGAKDVNNLILKEILLSTTYQKLPVFLFIALSLPYLKKLCTEDFY